MSDDPILRAALRWTDPVTPDMILPETGRASGWVSTRSGVYRGEIARWDGPLYSTELLALRALRYSIAMQAARRLRAVDIAIEKAGGET